MRYLNLAFVDDEHSDAWRVQQILATDPDDELHARVLQLQSSQVTKSIAAVSEYDGMYPSKIDETGAPHRFTSARSLSQIPLPDTASQWTRAVWRFLAEIPADTIVILCWRG